MSDIWAFARRRFKPAHRYGFGAAGARWITSWTTSSAGPWDSETVQYLGKEYPELGASLIEFSGTIRYRLRLAQGGTALRLSFSNPYLCALELRDVTVVHAAAGLNAAGGVDKLRFGGDDHIAIPPGATVISDELAFSVAHGGDILVSAYLPDKVSIFSTRDGGAYEAALLPDRDASGVAQWQGDKPVSMRPLVSRVDVYARARGVVVAFGDSITDGQVDPAGDRGWPGVLATRLRTMDISVVNAGIGGNRLLQPAGTQQPAALARLDRDVFSVSGITHIVLLEGINDINSVGVRPANCPEGKPASGTAEIISAYKQIINQAHVHNVKVIVGTLLPFQGCDCYTPDGESARQALNTWIRNQKLADGVIDFDKAMQDPLNPQQLRSDYALHDHLHPNTEGYRAMGNVIRLSLFR